MKNNQEITLSFKPYELDVLRHEIAKTSDKTLSDSVLLQFFLKHITGEDYQKLKEWYGDE